MRSTHGVYIPPSLQKDRFIFFAIDNSDFAEDTPDGKHTLHATATAVYQQKHQDDEPVTHLQVESTDSSAKSLTDVSVVTKLDPCNMNGNPKPKDSHRYENFRPLHNMHVLTQYQSEDIAWLLTKTPHINVVPLVNEDMDENLAENIQETAAAEKDIICKTAATWSSYNSLCATGKRPQTTVNALPLLAAPAHEWQTMVTVLKQAQKINVEVMGPERKTVITFDMALYEKARRLELLHPEFKDQFVFRIE